MAPYTTDGDLALSPEALADRPLLIDALRQAQFSAGDQPGSWLSRDRVEIDVMVPESLGGPGARGARLGVHGKRAARKAKGLEAALVDRSKMRVGSLTSDDSRSFRIWVAGPGALLVAKLHKIGERVGHVSRRDDKDALDVLRLLRYVPTKDLAHTLRNLMANPFSLEATAEAVQFLSNLFAKPETLGSQMAARATIGLEDPNTIAQSCAILASELLTALERQ